VEADALKVADLDCDRLRVEGADPHQAMSDVADWLDAVAGDDRPVICAFPASFDWGFFWWYMVRCGPDTSPLTFSSCLDMKTMLAVKGRRLWSNSGKDDCLSSYAEPVHTRTTRSMMRLDQAHAGV